ncbi:unnamed protein product [Spirodela intermedia]|uniref:Anaphase-promoting complex subunit 4-like WD40 domain-containing protein n=1 Tax=Spirodela intermedia TaxID=51605 RepID=A0A7I8J6M7_SPIIN|nr:unnamed protein product [Spirodela intermedia]CAA6665053.1 unnamed protein product [Spirodela intermedia]
MSRREIPPCSKTYGFPLYCASWVPLEMIAAKVAATSAAGEWGGEREAEEKTEGGDEGSETAGGGESASEGSSGLEEVSSNEEGRSGVPNALLLARFDQTSRSLSDEPVHRLGTGQDVPYRMALHPKGDGILCSFPNGCRWFEWEPSEDKKAHQLGIKSSGRVLTQLEDIGLQLALAFNEEGSLLATGGEDGHMRIFKWPSIELVFEQNEAKKSVKDLSFSCDGKFLASVADTGLCRVWDLDSPTIVANLLRDNGEKFLFCRFSQATDENTILYTLSTQDQFAKIVSWSTTSWNRLTSKNVSKDPVSAFSVSPDGKLLAIGTIEGDVVILDSSMRVNSAVKRAHLGLVTTLVFSHDSRALASASFDSSTRVTLVEKKRRGEVVSMWVIFFIILLAAILAYYIKENGGLLW